MGRRTHLVVQSEPCLFTAVQMQPASILRAGMAALSASIGGQLVEWRLLKRDHRVTVVIVGVRRAYLRDFDFFDADKFEVDAALVARGNGRFLEVECLLGSAGDPFARLTVLNRVVILSGSAALDATPGSLPDPLLRLLTDDEHDN